MTTTRESLIDVIGHLPHYSIGTRRVWWHDPSHDWQVRVTVDLGNGRLSIFSGPCWDHGGTPDGVWGEESSGGTIHHEVGGYNATDMVAFAEWVQDHYVGDDGILPAVHHLIACQVAQEQRERFDEVAASAEDEAKDVRRQIDRPKQVW